MRRYQHRLDALSLPLADVAGEKTGTHPPCHQAIRTILLTTAGIKITLYTAGNHDTDRTKSQLTMKPGEGL